jgi:uncharacterized protein
MANLLSHLPLIAATFFLAGLVKGVLGLGLPTVAMGLLGSTLGPAEAAAMLLVPSLLTNLWQLVEGARFSVLLRRFGPMMVGIGVGTVAGSGLIAGSGARFATAALGVTLLAYAVVGLTKLRLSVPAGAEGWAGPLSGIVTGLVTGATGVFVIPAVPYLAALELDRDDLVQALGLSFTVSTLALAAGLAWHGALPLQSVGASLLALIPALLGMALGGIMRARVKPSIFRRGFFLGLLVLGMEMVWHALA